MATTIAADLNDELTLVRTFAENDRIMHVERQCNDFLYQFRIVRLLYIPLASSFLILVILSLSVDLACVLQLSQRALGQELESDQLCLFTLWVLGVTRKAMTFA